MTFHTRTIFIIALVCSSLAVARAQGSNSVEQLRSQLSDIQANEAELQARDKQLDEDLRPENIERSLALNGSTRPEELREQRRRQLEKQKEEVRSQLEQLATSRARLEAAITTAEAAAYRQSAGDTIANTTSSAQTNTNSNQAARQTVEPQPTRRRRTRRPRSKRRG